MLIPNVLEIKKPHINAHSRGRTLRLMIVDHRGFCNQNKKDPEEGLKVGEEPPLQTKRARV